MQLPSVQLFDVFESSADVFFANRNPQPNEVQVAGNALLEFDSFNGVLGLTVTVNEILAYDWRTGAVNGFQLVEQYVRGAATHFAFLPPAQWVTGNEYEVTAAQGSHVETWTFFAYDIVPPLLRSVTAIDKDTLRITFNESVRMGAAAAGDALNPESYRIERVSRPAVVPLVTYVKQVNSSEVLLTTELELTFGGLYMLVATGIVDEFGNPFVAPNNVLEFGGWLPPYPRGRRFLLHDMVPKMSLAEDATQDLTLFLGCLQDTTNILLYTVDKWLEIIDPDTAPESFVDAMLADLGNPFTFELDLNSKRKLAKILVLIYQLKGTVPGIVDVVRFFLGIEVTVETFVGRGWRLGHEQLSTTGTRAPDPAIIGPGRYALYSFRIRTDEALTADQRSKILTIGRYMKGVQEHCIDVVTNTAPVVPIIPTPVPKTTKQMLSFTLAEP